MESNHGLNPADDIHLFVLHYVYIPRIKNVLAEFTRSWNNHPLRTCKNRTPLQLWTIGFYESVAVDTNLVQMTDTDLFAFGIDWNGPTPEYETNNHVVVPLIDLELSEEQINHLVENYDPLCNDDNYGIDIYLNFLEYVNSCL